MKINEQDFGSGYHLITITNHSGTSLAVTDLGARIVQLETMIDNEKRELVLGFDQAEEYLEKDPYIGATIGRTAGRITGGTFKLNGETIQVKTDPETGHCLHGGAPSFEEKQWNYTIIDGENEASVIFYTTSPDQENGFPGTLDVEVRYTLTNNDTWRVTIHGISDRETIFNPTNHVYFNLTGDVEEPIDQHTLWLNSRLFATLNKDTTPTGAVASVNGTAFDFQTPKPLAEVFESDFHQAKMVDGMDHPFLLKKQEGLLEAAELTSPDNKVAINVRTNASGIVLFTANFGEEGPMMRGKKLVHHGGITFEAQEIPGSEHLESFGDVSLKANEVRTYITEYQIKK